MNLQEEAKKKLGESIKIKVEVGKPLRIRFLPTDFSGGIAYYVHDNFDVGVSQVPCYYQFGLVDEYGRPIPCPYCDGSFVPTKEAPAGKSSEIKVKWFWAWPAFVFDDFVSGNSGNVRLFAYARSKDSPSQTVVDHFMNPRYGTILNCDFSLEANKENGMTITRAKPILGNITKIRSVEVPTPQQVVKWIISETFGQPGEFLSENWDGETWYSLDTLREGKKILIIPPKEIVAALQQTQVDDADEEDEEVTDEELEVDEEVDEAPIKQTAQPTRVLSQQGKSVGEKTIGVFNTTAKPFPIKARSAGA